ncbi:MAG: DUF1343 domain-containing protein [Oligoflexales bacterium]|nr:DUF1343 domain-containing protein [Oligoflexales bacterium]
MKSSGRVRSGLDVLRERELILRGAGHCALLCNQASIAKDFTHAISIIKELLGSRLKVLFNPQHGLDALVQDNMIESEHSLHAETGLPIYSLYSETREPTEKMLEGVDTIIIDLPVVGCRVYTFKATIAACLRAAKKFSKKVLVLDRPNPLGGQIVEGPVLEKDLRSFVGPFEIPMRHGLTMGEAAQLFNSEIGAELQIVPLESWDPCQLWPHTGLPWVITSPNLPSLNSVYLYPGMVLFEGTNLSEGRGTTLPFQWVGAEYLSNEKALVEQVKKYLTLSGYADPSELGVFLRPCQFMPTFHKWAGRPCRGLQAHILAPERVRSFVLALAIMRACLELGQGCFDWKSPPYEYEYERRPIDLLMGCSDFDRHFLEFSAADSYWSSGLENYIQRVQDFLLYPRTMQV